MHTVPFMHEVMHEGRWFGACMLLGLAVHDVTMSHLRLMPVDIGLSAWSTSKMMKGGVVGVTVTMSHLRLMPVDIGLSAGSTSKMMKGGVVGVTGTRRA
jgi:hypothetical protein